MPVPRLTDPTNAAKIEADRQRFLADPVYQATETTDANGQPRERTPASATTNRVAVPETPAPAAVPSGPEFVTPDGRFGIPAGQLGTGQPPEPLPTEPAAYLAPEAPAMPQAPPPTPPVQEAPAPEAADFSVLQQMQPTPQVEVPEPAPLSFDWQQSPAMLRSLAASTPPWRIPTPLLEQMQAAGIDEELIWSVPRRTGATA